MKTKRIFSFLTSAVCAVSLVSATALSVGADELIDTPLKYGDLSYARIDEDEDGTFDYIEITACDTAVTEIEVPSEIEGLPVASIGVHGFSACRSLETVVLPDTIIKIGNCAFFACKSLKNINLPDSLTDMDGSVFLECSGLESIVIPESITNIKGSTFHGCLSLTDITIPESVENVGKFAFKYTPWLKNKQAENPLVIVNDVLVDGTTCEGDVVIPDGIRRIANSAFDDCSALTNVTIPDSVVFIDEWAFSACSGLENINFPDSVTEIKWGAFWDCTGLKNVVIPESVTDLGCYVFAECTSLESVTIENPECYLDNDEGLFSNTYNEEDDSYSFDGTIYGHWASTAHEYALENNRKFETINGVVPGDMTGDSQLNLYDAIEIAKCIMESRELTDEEEAIADYNSDGVVNLYDVIEIAKKIKG